MTSLRRHRDENSPARRNGKSGDLDSTHMVHRVSAPANCLLVVITAACTVPTPGTPAPAPGTVTVVSTVTVPTRPVRRVFDADSVERGVVKILKDDYKFADIGLATCPEGQAVVPDTSFICVVQVDGQDKSIKITVKSEGGEYEVGQPR